jgi:hypothetical protein
MSGTSGLITSGIHSILLQENRPQSHEVDKASDDEFEGPKPDGAIKAPKFGFMNLLPQ